MSSFLKDSGTDQAGHGSPSSKFSQSRVTGDDLFPALLLTVYLIMREVKDGARTSFEDSFRGGRPNAVANDENMHSIQEMVEQD